MAKLEKVLSYFKGDPNISLSTQELVKLIFPESEDLDEIISDSFKSKEEQSEARKRLGVLKRRILYHLNSLVDKDILELKFIDSNGRKFYSLNSKLEKSKVIFEKEQVPALPIDSFEEKGFVYKLDETHFFDRVNSILLFNYFDFSLDKLLDYIHDLFNEVNDVVALYKFEQIFNTYSSDEIINFLENLNDDLEAYNKRVCFVINFNFLENQTVFSKFLINFDFDKKNLIFLWDVNGRNFLRNSNIVEELIEKFSYFSGKLNFKNSNISQQIYFLGKFGPYIVDKNEILKFVNEGVRGIVVTQSSILIDIKKIHSLNKAKGVAEVLRICAKSFLFVENYQRKHLDLLADKLKIKTIFQQSNNLIRFWNYEVFETIPENIRLLNLLESIKEEIDEFTRTEEIIFMSCGLPIKFKVDYSIAYRKESVSTLKNNFRRILISDISDLYNPDIRKRIEFYEKAISVLSDTLEIRFQRSKSFEVAEVLREINFILNSFKLPLFCYNFSGKFGTNMSLEYFIGGGSND